MAETYRVPVNWDVVKWAIENGEKSYTELKNKFRLDSWMSPKSDRDYPTFKQLQEFSKDTRTPFSYLFKDKVPVEEHEFVKYRTIDNSSVKPSRKLIDTIYAMQIRQTWMKDYLQSETLTASFKYLHFIKLGTDPEEVADKITKILGLPEGKKRYSLDSGRYFNLLRNSISKLDIMVMQNGIVGLNTHRVLEVEEFRAFALIDDTVPLIFLNGADSKTAKIFSLIHELVHVLLGENEVLNVGLDVDIAQERWINSVTANILLPRKEFLASLNDEESAEDNLVGLSRKFNTSLLATAIRARELHIYGDPLIGWAKELQANNMVIKNKPKIGNFYNNVASKVDPYFANAVISEESSGRLGLSEAAELIGTSLKTYKLTADKILGLE